MNIIKATFYAIYWLIFKCIPFLFSTSFSFLRWTDRAAGLMIEERENNDYFSTLCERFEEIDRQNPDGKCNCELISIANDLQHLYSSKVESSAAECLLGYQILKLEKISKRIEAIETNRSQQYHHNDPNHSIAYSSYDGSLHGEYVEHRDENVITHCYYQNGLLAGKFTEHDRKLQPLICGEYSNGIFKATKHDSDSRQFIEITDTEIKLTLHFKDGLNINVDLLDKKSGFLITSGFMFNDHRINFAADAVIRGSNVVFELFVFKVDNIEIFRIKNIDSSTFETSFLVKVRLFFKLLFSWRMLRFIKKVPEQQQALVRAYISRITEKYLKIILIRKKLPMPADQHWLRNCL